MNLGDKMSHGDYKDLRKIKTENDRKKPKCQNFPIRKNGWKMTVEAKEGIKAENRKRSKKKLSDWIFNSKKNY